MFYFSDCVPDPNSLEPGSDMQKQVSKIKKTLQDAIPPSPKQPPPNYDLVQSKVTLQALGLNIADKIVVGGLKVNFTLLHSTLFHSSNS